MLDHSAGGVLRLHLRAVDARHRLLAVRTDGADEPGTKERLSNVPVVQAATSAVADAHAKLL